MSRFTELSPEKKQRIAERQRLRFASLTPEQRAELKARRAVESPERKLKRRAKELQWRAAHPERVRSYSVKSKYGVSSVEHAELLAQTNGLCPGCKKPFSKTPCIDHDHVTGVVRGMLCKKCNNTLGQSEDSEATLLALVDYLRRSKFNQSQP